MDDVLIRVDISSRQQWGFAEILMTDKVQGFLQDVGDQVAARAGPEYSASVLENEEGRYSAAYVAVDPYTPEPEKTRAHIKQRKHGVLERAVYGR